MTPTPSDDQQGGRLRLVPVWTERRGWQRAAVLVRVVQVLAGMAVLLLPPHVRPLTVLMMLLGLLAAVISPARSGPAIALAAGVAGWVFSYGAHGSPPVLRTVAFALALFVLCDATALAGTVPVTATLRPEVLAGWLRRDAFALLVAGILAALVYLLAGLVGYVSSYPLQIVGLLGVVAVLGVAAWLFSRSLR